MTGGRCSVASACSLIRLICQRLGQERHPALVFVSHPAPRVAEVLTPQRDEDRDRRNEALTEPEQAEDAEARAETQIIERARRFVPALEHAASRPNHVAEQHIRQRSVRAARIGRPHRMEQVVVGAVVIVLMPVLDVGEAFLVVEPVGEFDVAGCERSVFVEDRAKRGFHRLPMKVDVVVAAHYHECVAGVDETRQGCEHRSVMLGDAPELGERVIDRAAQPVAALFVVRLGYDFVRRTRDAHAREVDQVARDYESPRQTAARAQPVPVEQRHELAIPAPARSAARRGVRPCVLHQVASQVDVGQDEQIVARHGQTSLNLRSAEPPFRQIASGSSHVSIAIGDFPAVRPRCSDQASTAAIRSDQGQQSNGTYQRADEACCVQIGQGTAG